MQKVTLCFFFVLFFQCNLGIYKEHRNIPLGDLCYHHISLMKLVWLDLIVWDSRRQRGVQASAFSISTEHMRADQMCAQGPLPFFLLTHACTLQTVAGLISNGADKMRGVRKPSFKLRRARSPTPVPTAYTIGRQSHIEDTWEECLFSPLVILYSKGPPITGTTQPAAVIKETVGPTGQDEDFVHWALSHALMMISIWCILQCFWGTQTETWSR